MGLADGVAWEKVYGTKIQKEEFSIGSTSILRLSKKDLIEAINKTFPDDFGTIAVLTECKTTDWNTKKEMVIQSIAFGKLLKY